MKEIIKLKEFCEMVGKTPCTVWHWRNKGWLKVVNISGKNYVTGSEVKRFIKRAQSGEFAKESLTPTPPLKKQI